MLASLPLESALIIAPHADDEVLGAGAFISHLSRAGCSVHVIFCAVDGFHHFGTPGGTTLEERETEIDDAARLLGFSYSILYRGRDLIEKLDTVPQRDLVDAFEEALNRRRPDALLLPHGVDFDQDHRACFQAGFAAARPMPASLGKHFSRIVLSYEMPKLAWSDQPFHPNVYLPISEHLDRKLEAIRCYKSQLRDNPHVRSIENLKALARLRGSEIGVDYAEAFFAHRWVI